MKIKKIFIKNFKGIKEKKIIDFNRQATFLTGPNGFGKTTIYDVIELCLTGKIHRTIVKKDVTNDRRDYIKPFYQNDMLKEVLIKLWLQKGESNLVIVKYLNADQASINYSSGRKNKPTDFYILKTYREINVENFNNEHFDSENFQELTQDEITDFFDLTLEKEKNGVNYKIDDIYMLFNYLQQEETTYFLKQSEKDRKDNIGFLFQTNKQEEKLNNIISHHQKFEDIQSQLEEKITQLTSKQILSLPYIQLFKNKEIEFDTQSLFNEMSLEDAQQKNNFYIKDVDNLMQFCEEFSPSEYSKRITTEKINKYLKDDFFIQFYLLSYFCKDEEFEKIKGIYDLVDNENMLKCYILQQFIPKHLNLVTINKYLNAIEEHAKLEDYEKKLKSLKTIIHMWNKDKLNEYSDLIINRNTYISTVDAVEKTLSEIVRVRNELRDKFDKSHKKDNLCPYCGYDWKTTKTLDANFQEREVTLKNLLSVQSTKLEEIENKINDDFLLPINKYIEKFQKENVRVDVNFLNILEALNDKEISFGDTCFDSLKGYIWNAIKPIEELDKNIYSIKEEIKAKINISLGIFKLLNQLKLKSFETQIDLVKNLELIDEFSKYIITLNEKNINESLLEVRQKSILDALDKKLLAYQYDEIKSKDENNYYEVYFQSSKENFHKYSKQNFIDKKSYINSQFKIKQNELAQIYKERKNKIDQIVAKLLQLKKIYTDEIKAYKIDMAEKIKIPFFLYTAKILQTYQQGMGIFLDTNANTAAIRFLTATDSDHDVMHHLSSGQLAVVSLAFCLAINKTYNISPNLKILAIDDPIQEMDALNIHSFIELIKNEFAKDYQLIFSTHHDMSAMYMKYKIENIYKDSVEVINVQKTFFGNLHDPL